mgnify:CR=1 FL=1
MPAEGVDAAAREAMTHKIAQRMKSMLQPGQDPVAAARQIEAKCFDSAKDAQDYERKLEKRLAKAAKALEASQRPSMSEPSDTAPLEKKQALARKRSREDPEVVRRPDASLIKTTRDVVTERLCSRNLRTLCPGQPDWGPLLQEAKRTGAARDLLREHGATLEWWRGAPAVIGRRLRSIIDAATQAGSVGDEARTWASGALQKVEKLEKAAEVVRSFPDPSADVAAVRALSHPAGLAVPLKNITVSTVGLDEAVPTLLAALLDSLTSARGADVGYRVGERLLQLPAPALDAAAQADVAAMVSLVECNMSKRLSGLSEGDASSSSTLPPAPCASRSRRPLTAAKATTGAAAAAAAR